MLDVGRLRFFSEVARARSFTEAALRLSYSQSAVSQQIATLEAELGLTLIERGTRPLRLTDAGESLLRHSEVIFGEVATAEAELRSITKLESGIVRVGGFSSACATILPMAFAQFLSAHPNVAVTLHELRPKAAHSALRAGELDLAVTYEYPPLEPAPADGLQRIPLGDDNLLVGLPTGHRLARRRSLRLEHLRAESWVTAPRSSTASEHRRHLEEHCARAGFQPNVRYEVNDIPTALGLIAAGLGVGLMPKLAFLTPQPGIATRALADVVAPFRRLYAVRVPQRRIPGIEPMLDVLQREVPLQLARSMAPFESPEPETPHR
jgi:DNA-binding transcriptional LysR family regulator